MSAATRAHDDDQRHLITVRAMRCLPLLLIACAFLDAYAQVDSLWSPDEPQDSQATPTKGMPQTRDFCR